MLFVLLRHAMDFLKEKDHALELWQTAAQELDRLQQMHQKVISDSQLHAAERQTMKVWPSVAIWIRTSRETFPAVSLNPVLFVCGCAFLLHPQGGTILM